MLRISLIAMFLMCLAVGGCERDEPDLQIDTPDGGVEVDVDTNN